MTSFLTLISGIAWSLVYVTAVRIGLRDKTYAMPLWALALNLAWEGIYATIALSDAVSLQALINLAWALLDVAVAYTYFRYGRRYWPQAFSSRLFVAWSLLVFATAFVLQLLFLQEFGFANGARYSAFLQNLLMSVLFINLFVSRRGPEGQSLVIAVSKWIGTLAPTIIFGVFERSPFILTVGALCSVFDLIYIALLLWARRRPHLVIKDRMSTGAPAELRS